MSGLMWYRYICTERKFILIYLYRQQTVDSTCDWSINCPFFTEKIIIKHFVSTYIYTILVHLSRKSEIFSKNLIIE